MFGVLGSILCGVLPVVLCSSLFYYLKLLYIICDLLLLFSSLVHTTICAPPNFHLGVLL